MDDLKVQIQHQLTEIKKNFTSTFKPITDFWKAFEEKADYPEVVFEFNWDDMCAELHLESSDGYRFVKVISSMFEEEGLEFEVVCDDDTDEVELFRFFESKYGHSRKKG